MSDYPTVDLLIEAIDEEPAGPLTSEGVALVRKGWAHGQEVAEAEISTLRQQLGQALADVARLREGFAEALSFADDHPGMPPTGHLHKLFEESRGIADDFIKLKQAEAVEEAVRECMPGPCSPPDDPPFGYQEYCEGVASVRYYAQRLRGEVDGEVDDD